MWLRSVWNKHERWAWNKTVVWVDKKIHIRQNVTLSSSSYTGHSLQEIHTYMCERIEVADAMYKQDRHEAATEEYDLCLLMAIRLRRHLQAVGNSKITVYTDLLSKLHYRCASSAFAFFKSLQQDTQPRDQDLVGHRYQTLMHVRCTLNN